jgi:hypothetical protein
MQMLFHVVVVSSQFPSEPAVLCGGYAGPDSFLPVCPKTIMPKNVNKSSFPGSRPYHYSNQPLRRRQNQHAQVVRPIIKSCACGTPMATWSASVNRLSTDLRRNRSCKKCSTVLLTCSS